MPHNVYDSLTLSDDAVIEAIITGIPLFCIGIFSIGVFTFLLVLKRVDLLSIFIFISSFLGFIAAILDLGQILIRGSSGIANGLRLGDVTGFINAREVLLAMSIGTILLFYWAFVGRRPIGSTSRKSTAPIATTMTTGISPSLHCGSWERWGYVGLALKWVTLVICVLIPILQIVWRVDPKNHRYNNLYVAASTFETTVPIIFILKIFLNLSLTPAEERRLVLLNHIAPICALLASAGHGIGNLVLFAFSETTLGRFLRAIEVYIIIVYLLIVTFRPASPPKIRHQPASSIEKPPLAYFNEDAERDPTTTTTTRQAGPTFLRPWRPARASTISKLSTWSWIASNRFNRISSLREPNATWSQDRELGHSPSEPSLLFRTTSESLDEKRLTGIPSSAVEGDGLLMPPLSSVDPSRKGDRPLTEISLSYYAMEDDSGMPLKSMAVQDTSSIGSNSPIYGLDGIIPPRRSKAVPESIVVQPPTTAKSRATSGVLSPIDQLMQQQSDLDRSITELRGLHNRQNSVPLSIAAVKRAGKEYGQIVTVPARDSTRNTIVITPSFATSLSKPSSASGHSDFSLSVFPEPPAVNGKAPGPIVKSSSQATLRPEVTRKEPKFDLVPIQIPEFDMASSLGSPSVFGLTGTRFDSAGTRYDVTSFIGGFTGKESAYTTGGIIASSSLYRTASLGEGDYANAQFSPTPATEKSASPASTIRSPLPPSASAPTPSPTKSQGLGSATMSSSFKAQLIGPVHAAPAQVQPEPQSPPAPNATQTVAASSAQQQRQSSVAVRPLLASNGSSRALPPSAPSGPRHSKSNSFSRSQSGAVRF